MSDIITREEFVRMRKKQLSSRLSKYDKPDENADFINFEYEKFTSQIINSHINDVLKEYQKTFGNEAYKKLLHQFI